MFYKYSVLKIVITPKIFTFVDSFVLSLKNNEDNEKLKSKEEKSKKENSDSKQEKNKEEKSKEKKRKK
jgi:hypothetical protein